MEGERERESACVRVRACVCARASSSCAAPRAEAARIERSKSARLGRRAARARARVLPAGGRENRRPRARGVDRTLIGNSKCLKRI